MAAGEMQIDLNDLNMDKFRSIASIAAFIAAEKMVNPACDGA